MVELYGVWRVAFFKESCEGLLLDHASWWGLWSMQVQVEVWCWVSADVVSIVGVGPAEGGVRYCVL